MTSYAAKGTQLLKGDGASPEVFTAIAQLGDLDGPKHKLDTVETTHHGSSAKEFAATILEGGEVSFSINYDPVEATHKNLSGGLLYDMQQKTLRNWKIQLTDAANTVITFAAFVTGFVPKTPVAGKLSADLTLHISGPVTWA